MNTEERKDSITAAELYAINVVKEEFKASGIKTTSIEGQALIRHTANFLAAHRKEIRKMYKTSQDLLRRWIVEQSGISRSAAFRRMAAIGFTGNIMEDIKRI